MTLIESMNDNFKILPKIFVCDLRLEGPVIAGLCSGRGSGGEEDAFSAIRNGGRGCTACGTSLRNLWGALRRLGREMKRLLIWNSERQNFFP